MKKQNSKPRFSYWGFNSNKIKEPGNIIETFGSLFAMLFAFTMLLVMTGYYQLVQLKIDINSVAKEYLYVMEQRGYLPEDADIANASYGLSSSTRTKEQLLDDLNKLGATATLLSDTQIGAQTQVAYGERVDLNMDIEIKNPIYTYFGGKEADLIFPMAGFHPRIKYNLHLKATSKW